MSNGPRFVLDPMPDFRILMEKKLSNSVRRCDLRSAPVIASGRRERSDPLCSYLGIASVALLPCNDTDSN